MKNDGQAEGQLCRQKGICKVDISVIVPVYNCERYLEKCVKSILSQTHKSIEIILVDDGSKDKSGDMCDDFAEKDPRIKVIHQKNAGASHARNVGIGEAQGETIIFVDSDDYVDSELCEKMWHLYKTHNLDMCVHGVKNEYYNGDKPFRNTNVLPHGGVYDSVKEAEQELIGIYENYLFFSVCTRLYKRSLILDNSLRFDEGIHLGEDLLFNLKYILHCKKIAAIAEPLYTYRHFKRESLTQRFYEKRTEWAGEILEGALNFLDKFDMSKDFYREVYKKYYLYCICGAESIFFSGCYLTSKEKNAYVKKIIDTINDKIERQDEKDKDLLQGFDFYKILFSLRSVDVLKLFSLLRLKIKLWLR